jgi:hypothetical protein
VAGGARRRVVRQGVAKERKRRQKQCFFEKKNQKTFAVLQA